MAKLAIYTHNTRLFYNLTKIFRAEKINFTALDSFNDIYPSAQLLITTQQDLDKYKPKFSNNVDVLVLKPNQTNQEILYQTLQHLYQLHPVRSITIAIDPGTKKTGLAVFMNNTFLYSKCVDNLSQLLNSIRDICNSFNIQKILIKIGNGNKKLTKNILSFFFSNADGLKPVEYMLVDEVYTSKKKEKKSKEFKSVHEKSAYYIGKRPGEFITSDNMP